MSITSLNATPNTYKDNGISQPEVAVLGELPPHLLRLLPQAVPGPTQVVLVSPQAPQEHNPVF